MARLRHECPWDVQQTHRSLVQYLVEETAETIEAIELANQDHLREELGDLLLQVIFHAEIAGEQIPGFTVEDVARGIADKLISRHPYVFATADVPSDLHYTWEQRKAAEKRSEEHTSELQSRQYLVCRLLLEKKQQAYRDLPPLPKQQQQREQE